MTVTAATAWSMGGRTFSFVAPLAAPLHIGAPVLLTSNGQQFLGQVIEKEPQNAANLASGAQLRTVAGEGTLIARLHGDRIDAVGADDTFDDATVEPAPPAAVDAWLGAGHQQATLGLGALRIPPGTRRRCRPAASTGTPSCAGSPARGRPTRSASSSSNYCCERASG